MTQHAHAITDAALALDPSERLELANLLIDSVEDGNLDKSWTEAWAKELDRRSVSANSRSERGRHWQDIRTQILQTLAR